MDFYSHLLLPLEQERSSAERTPMAASDVGGAMTPASATRLPISVHAQASRGAEATPSHSELMETFDAGEPTTLLASATRQAISVRAQESRRGFSTPSRSKAMAAFDAGGPERPILVQTKTTASPSFRRIWVRARASRRADTTPSHSEAMESCGAGGPE